MSWWNPKPWGLGWSTVVISLVFIGVFAFGSVVASNDAALKRDLDVRGSFASATVVSVETITTRSYRSFTDKYSYVAKVRFRAMSGQLISTHLDEVDSADRYSAGDSVRVIYDRNDPSRLLDATVNRKQDRAVVVFTAMAAVSAIALGLGVWRVLNEHRRKRGGNPRRKQSPR